jgi:phosphotransferase system HPr-like phosphotransfer protein
MAKGQSTSDARVRRRGGRERLGSAVVVPGDAASAAGGSVSQLDEVRRHPLELILESERGRLADAQSVLACLHVALLHADERRIKADPDYAGAAAIALELIKETADRLDAAIVRPLLSAGAGNRVHRRSPPPRG